MVTEMNLLTVKQVASKLSCAVSYVYKLQKTDKSFPKPLSIGMGSERSRGVRWVEQDVTDWLLTRKQTTTEVLNNEDGRIGEDVHTGTGEEVAA